MPHRDYYQTATALAVGRDTDTVLDLHGLTWREARIQVDRALAARARGATRVRIVTGVGKHSAAGGAVLRPRLTALLASRRVAYEEIARGVFELRAPTLEPRTPAVTTTAQRAAAPRASPPTTHAHARREAIRAEAALWGLHDGALGDPTPSEARALEVHARARAPGSAGLRDTHYL